MKFFSKVAAILAALMLACAFVACSNDSSDGGSSVANSSASAPDVSGETLLVTFVKNSDNSIRFYTGNKVIGIFDGDTANPVGGTYTGSPTSDGTVTCSGALAITATISNSGNTLTYTNSRGRVQTYTKQ